MNNDCQILAILVREVEGLEELGQDITKCMSAML